MDNTKLLPCKINIIKTVTGSVCDGFICIETETGVPKQLLKTFDDHRKFDKAFDKEVSVFIADNFGVPIVYSPVGVLTPYQDVRTYQKAVEKGICRAIKAGLKNPALLIPKSTKKFPNLGFCCTLGALHELYVPIQLREDVPAEKERVKSFSFVAEDPNTEEQIRKALFYEPAKFIARDIGGADPERMTAKKIESYIKPIFNNSIKIEVIEDLNVLKKEYPLFEAVNRAGASIDRHRGRIVIMEYKPSEPAVKTLMLVGKGVTYDMGGADIRADGIMSGSSREKCGAAAVAGFMKVVQDMKPKNIHVFGVLCLLRNSVGEECYVSDEVITSRAGVRVRIGDTDAEGRTCVADPLCRMKELVLEKNLPDPHLFTISSGTGHSRNSVGLGYTCIVDNSVAQAEGHNIKLRKIGEEIGEPFSISIMRPEDFDFNAGKGPGEDLINCNNLPSELTPRGHIFPAAFINVAAGLNKHEKNSERPIKYTHLDISPSCGYVPNIATGHSIIALARTHLE